MSTTHLLVCSSLFVSGYSTLQLFHRWPLGGQDIMLHKVSPAKVGGTRKEDITVGL